jgi:hypothetical protein
MAVSRWPRESISDRASRPRTPNEISAELETEADAVDGTSNTIQALDAPKMAANTDRRWMQLIIMVRFPSLMFPFLIDSPNSREELGEICAPVEAPKSRRGR